MSALKKHLLVYASGKVVESTTPLLGRRHIVPEQVDGDWWKRTFEIHLAHNESAPGELAEGSMVGIEVSFELTLRRKQIAVLDAERRARSMRQALWGVMNYPSDGNGDE